MVEVGGWREEGRKRPNESTRIKILLKAEISQEMGRK